MYTLVNRRYKKVLRGIFSGNFEIEKFLNESKEPLIGDF